MELPAAAKARHKAEGQAKVKCNAIYRKDENLNVYMRPAEAIAVARGLLQKAQLLLEEGLAEEWAVHLWNKDGETLYCGITIARKGKAKLKAKAEAISK